MYTEKIKKELISLFTSYSEDTTLNKKKINKYNIKRRYNKTKERLNSINGTMNKYQIERAKSDICTFICLVQSKLFLDLKIPINEDVIEILDPYIDLLAKSENELLTKNLSEEQITKVLDNIHTDKKFIIAYALLDFYDILLFEDKKKEIQDNVQDDPLSGYKSEFDRHYHIHVGQTNTGKTYSGMQALISAKTGVYLSPLRLLALEKQDELNKEGCICSMITGEEENILPFATHMSCTVELLDYNAEYEVAVIDECQMIGDKNRGQFWTQAILNVKAHDIYLCFAPEALNLIKDMLETIDADFDITEHERNTPLICQKNTYNIETDVQKGDALVVFSRKSALFLAAHLRELGHSVSIIYGNLPYSTRKLQMERFINGDTDVVVATDAIGMGLNLPIKRIVFMEDRKFDGVKVRPLTTSEIKQIAGRAGRMGIFDEGYVATSSSFMVSTIKNALKKTVPDLKHAYIGFSKDIINVDREDIFETISLWSKIDVKPPFKKISVDHIMFIQNKIAHLLKDLSKKDILKLIRIPFNEKNDTITFQFVSYVRFYIENKDDPTFYGEVNFPVLRGASLEDYETYYGMLDLYYSFSKNFKFYIDTKHLIAEKERTSNKINDLLLKNNEHRKCRTCKTPLPWDYPYGQCNKCYHAHSRYHEDEFYGEGGDNFWDW